MPNLTTNYQLEKPLGTENYDVNVQNRNMDKLDVAINNVKNDIATIELTSTKVLRPNSKTVEQSISDNETSISNLQNELGANKTTLEANINDIRVVL